jgi:hypothetical protein
LERSSDLEIHGFLSRFILETHGYSDRVNSFLPGGRKLLLVRHLKPIVALNCLRIHGHEGISILLDCVTELHGHAFGLSSRVSRLVDGHNAGRPALLQPLASWSSPLGSLWRDQY